MLRREYFEREIIGKLLADPAPLSPFLFLMLDTERQYIPS